MEQKPLGFYNYTVVLTYIGMLTGFLGISCVMSGRVETAMVCLMIAGVCDMFDGAIASTRKRTMDEKCFGIQIDSLSDLICFGVLPALMVEKINDGQEIAFAIASLYVLSALIRLAYFNVDEQKRQQSSSEGREWYEGLPVTTVAVILPLVWMITAGAEVIQGRVASTLTLMIVAVLFLTPFKLRKPKITGKVFMGLCGLIEFVVLIMGMGDI